jgi:hypothetical protein
MASIVSAGTTSATALNMSADTTGILQLASNNGTVGLTLNTSQNVGIGTTSPAVKLEIGGTNPTINIGATNTASGAALSYNTASNYFSINAVTQGVGYRNIILANDGGNVGVGTTAPLAKLSLGNLVSAQKFLVYDAGDNFKYGFGIQPNEFRQFYPSDAFWTIGTISTANGSTFVERLRIESLGKVVIGNTGSFGNGGLLEVDATNQGSNYNGINVKSGPSSYAGVFYAPSNNFVYFTITGTGSNGTIMWNGTNTVYATSSDQRLKENIVDAPSALNRIDSVKIRSFNWIDSKVKVDFGVVAQELFEIAPEAVSVPQKEEDTWGVDSSVLVPTMIKAIQELNAKVTALENK